MKRLIKTFLFGITLLPIYFSFADTNKELPIVVLETSAGTIEISVNTDKAPLSSASFLTAVDNHLLENNAAFYRVVRKENDTGSPDIAVIQGGILDQSAALPLVFHETTEQTGLLHQNGTISLARAPGSTGGGTTFFICIGDQPSLDYGEKRYADKQGFAAFGQVIEGMDIVRTIQRMRTQSNTEQDQYAKQLLVNPVKILRAFRQ